MKRSMRTIFVFLAAVLSLVAVHAVWAADIELTGTIERIGTASIDVLDANGSSHTFYDIPFTELETQKIFLALAESVTVKAYVVTFPNGTVKNIAYSITYGNLTYSWHPNVPKAGTNKAGINTVTLSATNENGQPCHCNCIETTVCYECNCYCGANR